MRKLYIVRSTDGGMAVFRTDSGRGFTIGPYTKTHGTGAVVAERKLAISLAEAFTLDNEGHSFLAEYYCTTA